MTSHTEIGESTAIGRSLPATSMSRTAVMVRWLVGAAGVLLLGALLFLNPPATTRFFVLFAFAIIASELLLTVRIAPGSYFSVSSTFLFVYFLIGGGLAAAVLDAAAKLLVWVAEIVMKRNPPTSLFALFSVGQAAVSTLAAAFAVTIFVPEVDISDPILVRPVTSMIIFALAYLGVNAATNSLAIASRGSGELRSVLVPQTGVWGAVSLLTSLPFAVILTLVARGAIGYIWATLLIFLLLAGISFAVKLNVRMRQTNEELKTINRIGSLINATLDLSQLFRILARESRRVIQWDGFFIALVEKGTDQVQLIFMTGSGDEITQRTIRRGAGLTGKALETGETIFYERQERESIADEEPMSGQKKARSIVVTPMKFNEEIIGALSVQSLQRDVYGRSELRLLQTVAAQAAIAVRNAQLFQSEQTAKNERDEFLSLVTHEIKNPLTSIRGYADIAEVAIGSNDSEQTLDALRVIREESKRILRLAEDLLDASRAAAGKFSVKFETMDVVRIVRDIVTRYEATSQRPFRIDAPADAPHVHGDPVRLAQVIENLVSNAVKYSPVGTPIHVSVYALGSILKVDVTDFGPGIAPEKLPLIFERFYRVEEAGTEVKGTGLGLYITREIVRMHGGTIEAQSVLEKGTTFSVQLPLRAR